MKNFIKFLLLFLFLAVVFMFSVRGLPGNPNGRELQSSDWRDNGPFELSPERGRFALTYSLVEEHSVYFPLDVARFVIPDLGFKDGHYVSLFAPALGFVTVPGYLIGKYFGASQVGTFFVVSIFAIINFFLIYLISNKIGANKIASVIGGLAFLFATPAFAYAVDLYQHQLTAFILLLSLLIYINYKNFWSAFWIFLIYALGLTLDYPNIFLLFPVALLAGLKIFEFSNNKKGLNIKIKTIQTLSILGVVLPMLFFFWFNKASYGSPFTTLGSSKITFVGDIDENGSPYNPNKPITAENEPAQTDQEASGFAGYFKSRKIVNGLYILLLSPDRGVVVFTPIVLFGIIGAFYFKKSKYNNILPILVSIITIDLTLYAMWGDPWGGWAFGARYLIPGYAILAILVSMALTNIGKRWYFVLPFWLIFIYSLFVNTLGALTTSAMPPQVEASALGQLSGKLERYSWDRNWEFINSGRSKSFVFQTWGHNYVSALQYFYTIFGTLAGLSTVLIIAQVFRKDEN